MPGTLVKVTRRLGPKDGESTGDQERRTGEDESNGGVEAECVDDGREEILEAVGRKVKMLKNDKYPDLWVDNCFTKTAPWISVAFLSDCISQNAIMCKLTLLRRKPSRRQRFVRKSKARHDSHNKRDRTLKNKQPSPALNPSKSIHTLKNTRRNQARKSRSKDITRVKNTNPRRQFLPGIKRRQHVQSTGVIRSLHDTEEESREKSAGVVVGYGSEGTDDGPCHHETTHVP